MVSIPFDSGVGSLTLYLFGWWAVFIVILALLPRSRADDESEADAAGESRMEG
jgi:hypothetical protein